MEWDEGAAVTPPGLLPHFADFLKTADLFDPGVAGYPLRYSSPNAPAVRDILGTIMLSVPEARLTVREQKTLTKLLAKWFVALAI